MKHDDKQKNGYLWTRCDSNSTFVLINIVRWLRFWLGGIYILVESFFSMIISFFISCHFCPACLFHLLFFRFIFFFFATSEQCVNFMEFVYVCISLCCCLLFLCLTVCSFNSTLLLLGYAVTVGKKETDEVIHFFFLLSHTHALLVGGPISHLYQPVWQFCLFFPPGAHDNYTRLAFLINLSPSTWWSSLSLSLSLSSFLSPWDRVFVFLHVCACWLQMKAKKTLTLVE